MVFKPTSVLNDQHHKELSPTIWIFSLKEASDENLLCTLKTLTRHLFCLFVCFSLINLFVPGGPAVFVHLDKQCLLYNQ